MMYYKSESMTMSSTPIKGKVYGYHNLVEIKNGKGKKRMESLSKNGKVIASKTKTLKNIQPGNAKTRKQTKTKGSAKSK